MKEIPSYLRYWGKAHRHNASEGNDYHLLAWHSLDVAACGYQLIMSNRFHAADIFQSLGFEREEAARWFAYFLGWHDIGKFARGFQQLYAHQCTDLVPPAHGRYYSHRHDTLGYWLWKHYISEQWQKNNADFFPKISDKKKYKTSLNIWMQIMTGHHGEPPDTEAKCILSFTIDDQVAAGEWVRDLGSLFNVESFPDCFTDETWRSQFKKQSWLLAGLTVLADWLGSNQHYFPYVSRPMGIQLYWQQALEQSKAAVAMLPEPSHSSTFEHFHTLFPYIEQLTPLQQRATTLDISHPGPQLIVLEDVTGAGKTEAALILAHRMMSANKADSLYIGLPTMATANAMFQRMGTAYRALFQQQDRPSLVLAHGAREMSAAFSESLWQAENQGQTRYNAEDAAASSECNYWFADSRKKALLAEAGVGTLDQVLMAAMPFRHQSLRALGIYHKLLILDEIHAYDAYMVKLLEGLLSLHASLGGSVILLSATLPFSLREKLLGAFQRGAGLSPTQPDTQAAYPWLSHLHTHGLDESYVATREQVKRHVGVEWLTDIEQSLALINQAVHDGQCVCWVRNTVDDAISAYQHLIQSGNVAPENLLLFHSRFAFTDRMAIEEKVLTWFGKESVEQQRHGKVLIATQVVEQSLDIDFDMMITDLAPVDLLIQRAGRLQRHIRQPRLPPVLHILAPEWQPEPQDNWPGEALRGTGAVYRDHACLWRTQYVLRELNAIRMPDEARQLVEQVYGDMIAAPPGLQRSEDNAYGLTLSEKASAAQNLLKPEKGYALNSSDFLWSKDIELSTRLSDESVELFLAWRDENDELQPYASHPSFPWEQSRLQIRLKQWQKMEKKVPRLTDDALDALRKKIHRPGAQVMLIERDKTSEHYSSEWGLWLRH